MVLAVGDRDTVDVVSLPVLSFGTYGAAVIAAALSMVSARLPSNSAK